MIDERNGSRGFSGSGGGGGGLRHIGYNRFGDTAPDYEDVKDEYSIEKAVFGGNRFRDKQRGEFNIHNFPSQNVYVDRNLVKFFLSFCRPQCRTPQFKWDSK